jgi:hypothetical protein
VTNRGKISHDFKIKGKKTALLSPGKSATLKVVIPKVSLPLRFPAMPLPA